MDDVPIRVTEPRACHRPALLFLLASSCFYPWQEDAEKDGETERCFPVYRACSMNNEVPKHTHHDGNNQAYSKSCCKIYEQFLDVHSSISFLDLLNVREAVRGPSRKFGDGFACGTSICSLAPSASTVRRIVTHSVTP